jgi:hypothetical protein
MKPINKIAFDVLIYFYNIERKAEFDLSDVTFEFTYSRNLIYELSLSNENLKEDLLKLSDNSNRDLFKTFEFLKDENLLNYKELIDSGGKTLINTRLTSYGVKMVEGIDSPEFKKVAENHFHFSLVENATVESLIKTELSGLKIF